MILKLRGDAFLSKEKKQKKQKKKHRAPSEINTSQIIFRSASSALPTMADEYTKERERGSILDNKSSSLITILIALITVYVPIIPFNTIISTCLNGSKGELALTLLAVIMIISTFVITAISFNKLIKTVKLQEYRKADIDMICKEENLKCDKDAMEKALCEHYQELIHFNSKINNDKAKNLGGCFNMVTIVFFLLLVSTVILKCIN